jgi:hypothetical protein
VNAGATGARFLFPFTVSTAGDIHHRTPPMDTGQRSVWGTSTDEFKKRFREYLQELAKSDDTYRVDLIDRLEWCFDRWNDWREAFYPETAEPMLFPFFETHQKGSELGSYAVCGNSGQPSVISLKLALLTGGRDVTLFRSNTERLVLKGDRPRSDRVANLVIIHELVHQFLHEGADARTRERYESTECASGRQSRYKGHGDLFATECNRISEQLHPELGFRVSPVRHMKRSHSKGLSRRVSCGQFGLGNLFFLWDPTLDDLSPHEVTANRERLEQALEYFEGAVDLVPVEPKVIVDFAAPFTDGCASVCHQELTAFDQNNGTTLVHDFRLAVVQQLHAEGALESLLAEVGHSVAQSDISPAEGEKVPMAAPVEETIEYVDGSVHTIDELMDDIGLGDVPTGGDKPTLKAVYPVSDAFTSLGRLLHDIDEAGGKAALCVDRFGLKDGSSLSRHLKELRKQVTAA